MNTTEMTAAQREAVETDATNVVLLAGPGSGKTFTVVARIERLIRDGVSPPCVAAITFTNAAARELEERILLEISTGTAFHGTPFESHALGFCGTLHGFALRCLKRFGGDHGYGDRTSIISPESAEDLLASKAKTLGCKTPVDKILKIKSDMSRAWTGSVEQSVIALYEEDLREAGIVDFDLLLSEFLSLLQGSAIFANRVHEQFSYLFVDEVQDSGPVDWAIYRILAIVNKFFVGDPDQSIYKFRGADVSLIVDECNDLATCVIKLEDNFRSRFEITEAAQRLIERNEGRIPKRTASVKGPGGSVHFFPEALNEGDEIGKVAIEIRNSMVDPSEIAVLARTNAIANGFARTLAATGLPVRQAKKSELPDDWRFCRSLLELLVNPECDALAFFYLVALYEKKGAPANEARNAAHAVRRSALAVGRSINASNLGFKVGMNSVEMAVLLTAQGISRESRMLVSELILGLPRAGDLADLALAAAQVRDTVEEATGEGINVLTFHGSKGREFDVVFLVGLEDETIPGKRKDVEEERRLLFVGITRAREKLYLSSCGSRVAKYGTFEKIEARTPSRFLKEIAP